jgi:phospholipase/carboxylesterase
MNQRLHQDQPIHSTGEPLNRAHAAMVLLHGRGASAEDILTLVPELDHPGFAYLAPQAANGTWYPYPFMSPLASNEPWLSSALQVVADALAQVAAAGIPPARTLLLGFSQGACLAVEFAARHARRYGGVAGLTGGLIGPDDTPRDYAGSLAGTPVFLGCSDVDVHIPKARVELTAQVLERLGGQVTMRFYPNMGHAINGDEIDFVRGIKAALTTRSRDSSIRSSKNIPKG